jgi:Ran GTPase-activating protein (RanGAP) involved in mRNA processing and transport
MREPSLGSTATIDRCTRSQDRTPDADADDEDGDDEDGDDEDENSETVESDLATGTETTLEATTLSTCRRHTNINRPISNQ